MMPRYALSQFRIRTQVLAILVLSILRLEAASLEPKESKETSNEPLAAALIEPFSMSIRCPAGEIFNWNKADQSGLDIVMYYTCGESGEMSQTMHCTNGYKATFRRDLIPEAMKRAAIPMATKRGSIAGDDEPSFGVFSSGPDYKTKNGAVVVFACVNPN